VSYGNGVRTHQGFANLRLFTGPDHFHLLDEISYKFAESVQHFGSTLEAGRMDGEPWILLVFGCCPGMSR
jgi:hypothetical protein